jgi:hypothetical protein
MGGSLIPTMIAGVGSAVPIWQLSNITEEQYLLDYEFKQFVKNKEAITQLVKEAFEVSLNFLEKK